MKEGIFRPPNDEDRLATMGTERVLSELRKKFGLDNNKSAATEAGSNDQPDRSKETWQERLSRKATEREKAMEGAGVREIFLSEDEVVSLQKTKRGLAERIQTAFDLLRDLDIDMPEYREAANKQIDEIVGFLDNSDFWATRFTTAIGSGSDAVSTSSLDSVYYMTRSGVSLRIKRSVIDDGYKFKNAVQPFMELTLFGNPHSEQERFKQLPENGLWVKDFLTPGFEDLISKQNGGKEYHSPLHMHEKDGWIVGVTGPDNVWIHEGDRVNSISQRGNTD